MDLNIVRAQKDPRIAAVLVAVSSDLTKLWTIEEMAGLVNLSPSRFGHLFVAETGLSPSRFFLERRLSRAHQLLLTTFLSVKEVPGLAGFRDRSYFNRVFKNKFGIAPSAVRDLNIAGDAVAKKVIK